jgi:hypothetical protein
MSWNGGDYTRDPHPAETPAALRKHSRCTGTRRATGASATWGTSFTTAGSCASDTCMHECEKQKSGMVHAIDICGRDARSRLHAETSMAL